MDSPIWQRAALQWVIRRERIHQLLEVLEQYWPGKIS